jgi:hypothetical protein
LGNVFVRAFSTPKTRQGANAPILSKQSSLGLIGGIQPAIPLGYQINFIVSPIQQNHRSYGFKELYRR